MPIDDALENIDDNKTSGIKQASVAHIDDSFASDVIKKYIKAIETFVIAQRLGSFNAEIIQKYSDFLRFGEKCYLNFKGIEKEKLIELIAVKDPDASYLLEKTDINEQIKYPFIIQHEQSYNPIPNFINLKSILDLEQIQKFNSLNYFNFIIPDLEFFSLFIEKGEMFRKYIKTTKINQMTMMLMITDSTNNHTVKNIEIFTTKLLRTFCEQTKTTEIKQIINQVNEFYSVLKSFRLKENSELREFLHSRLKQYNPQLVYEGA